MGVFIMSKFLKSRYVIWNLKHKKEMLKTENNLVEVTFEIKDPIITWNTVINVYQKIKIYRQIHILTSK